MSQPHPTEDEVQFASVDVTVALPVRKDEEDRRRRRHIRHAVSAALVENPEVEFRDVRQVQLRETETMEEAGERHVAEAEAAYEAEAQAAYERHLDNRRGW